MYLQTKLNGGRTTLGPSYFTAPFKLMQLPNCNLKNGCTVMIMNASPGVLDEDHYNIKIDVTDQTSLALVTQSYQRLFKMNIGATQTTTVYVGNGALFSFLPHPVVPHAGAHFTAVNNIYLAHTSRLIWGEVLTAGRMLHNERFVFTYFQNLTSIYLDKKLVIKDNLVIEPVACHPQVLGNMEKYTHHASFIFVGALNDFIFLEEEIKKLLACEENILWGMSRPAVPGIMVRLLGYKGEQLHRCLQTLSHLFSYAAFKAVLHVA